MVFKLDGKILNIDVPFKTSDGTNYPSNWLRLTTLEEKKAIGITEEDDSATFDTKYYIDASTPKTLTDTDAKDDSGNLIKDSDGNQVVIKGLISKLVDEQKEIANSLLTKYDWQVTRKIEKGTDIDPKIVTYRDSIRTVCATRETEIKNVKDVPELVTLMEGTFNEDGVRTAGITLFPVDPYNPIVA